MPRYATLIAFFACRRHMLLYYAAFAASALICRHFIDIAYATIITDSSPLYIDALSFTLFSLRATPPPCCIYISAMTCYV